MNLAVFASTKGTDLQAILIAKAKSDLKFIDLKFVLSDKKDSGSLQKARSAGIKDIFLDPKGKSKSEYDAHCLALCRQHKIDYILLKYPGMDLDVHKAVLEAKEKETGCTLHFVDEGVDTGKIFMQEKVVIAPDDTPETLKKKVQVKEQEVIL